MSLSRKAGATMSRGCTPHVTAASATSVSALGVTGACMAASARVAAAMRQMHRRSSGSRERGEWACG